jgi:hypothetical protein
MIRIPLTEEQRTLLLRPVGLPLDRCGGFQRLIYRLQDETRMSPAGWQVVMTADDARAVLRYSNPSYGEGTYQKILRAIAPQVQAALDAAGAVQTGSLF